MAAASGTPPLTARTRWRAGTVAIALSGELDICTKPALARLLGEVLARRPERLVLDLAGVTFIDCAAAGVLVAASRGLPGNGKPVISRMSRPAGRLIRLTGLHRYFEIADRSPGSRAAEPGCGHAGRVVASLTWHSPSPALEPLSHPV